MKLCMKEILDFHFSSVKGPSPNSVPAAISSSIQSVLLHSIMASISIILGKWEYTSNENFEAYVKALGGFQPRTGDNWPHDMKANTEFIESGDGRMTQKNTSGATTVIEFTFAFGVETRLNYIVPSAAGGQTMLSKKFVITLEGNKMIQKGITNGIETETVREFNGDEMVAIYKAGSVIATRKYRKVAAFQNM